jgi:hypothetical protein
MKRCTVKKNHAARNLKKGKDVKNAQEERN